MKNNTGTPVEVKNTLTATPTGKKHGVHQEWHLNGCTFRCVGRKWEFNAVNPKDQKNVSLLVQVRGGRENAERVATLFASDVTKYGKLGSNRANINRLVAATL